MTEAASLCERLLFELEARDDVKVDERLSDVVDPDALDAIGATRLDGTDRRGARIEFDYCGCRIVIDRDNEIWIDADPPDERLGVQ